MKAVEFGPDAQLDLDAAAQAYEADRPGRGERFFDAIERTVKLIAAFPEIGIAFALQGSTSTSVGELCWGFRSWWFTEISVTASASMRSLTPDADPVTGAVASRRQCYACG